MSPTFHLTCAPRLLLLRLLLFLLAVAILKTVPVSAQYRHILFGPPPMPPKPTQCHCVPANLCPAHLTTVSPALCAGPGMVCCLARTASPGLPGEAPGTLGGRPCGRPGQPDSGSPWTVAVTRRDPDGLLYSSAGALLSPTLVITVAHGVLQVPAEELVVVADMDDLLEDSDQEIFRRVAAVIVHPRYHPGDQKHNLAILRLETPLEPSGGSAPVPICLPIPPAPPVDQTNTCWASGWGRDVATHSSLSAPLVDVHVEFVSSEDCLDSLADQGQAIDLSADLCMKARRSEDDLCRLDPGSPVVCPAVDGSATLVGMASWARRCSGGRREPMVVAASITPHLEWITNVLEA